MTVLSEQKTRLHAWGTSAALHSLMVGLAMYFVAQVQPLPLKEPFRWEVSLVQAVTEDSPVAPTKSVRSPQPLPPREKAIQPVEPVPRIVTRQIQTTDAPMVVEQERPQIVELTKPIVQTKAVEKREEVTREQVQPQHVQAAERQVEQPVHETVHGEPVYEMAKQEVARHEAVMTASQPVTTPVPVTTSQPSSAPVTVEKQVHEAPVAQSAPTSATAHNASEAPSTPEVPQASGVIATSPSPLASDAPVQVAKAVTPGPEPKADHRWLAESLWRRVAELKRYPSSARLNGLEGKVILKAIIRSDGHLAELSVQQSSGHTVLDEAAMEAVRLACPLHMKHELGKPQIVVSLPIVYSLAN